MGKAEENLVVQSERILRMLHDREVDTLVYESVTIDAENVDNEVLRPSADQAYWGLRWADAKQEFNSAKIATKESYAKNYLLWREKLLMDGKVTEALIEQHVVNDPEYQAVRRKEVSVEAKMDKLSVIVDAVQSKRAMLKEYGEQKRAEMLLDPSVREDMRVRQLKREG
jgi:hypothetical protein